MNTKTKHLGWDTALLGSFALLALTAWAVLVLQVAPYLMRFALQNMGNQVTF
jgi:hypothetical protein